MLCRSRSSKIFVKAGGFKGRRNRGEQNQSAWKKPSASSSAYSRHTRSFLSKAIFALIAYSGFCLATLIFVQFDAQFIYLQSYGCPNLELKRSDDFFQASVLCGVENGTSGLVSFYMSRLFLFRIIKHGLAYYFTKYKYQPQTLTLTLWPESLQRQYPRDKDTPKI